MKVPIGLTAKSVRVCPVGRLEGGSLILRQLGYDSSHTQFARALSTELGGLPLAMVQFSAYIAQTGFTDVEILRIVKDRQRSRETMAVEDITEPVAAPFEQAKISFGISRSQR